MCSRCAVLLLFLAEERSSRVCQGASHDAAIGEKATALVVPPRDLYRRGKVPSTAATRANIRVAPAVEIARSGATFMASTTNTCLCGTQRSPGLLSHANRVMPCPGQSRLDHGESSRTRPRDSGLLNIEILRSYSTWTPWFSTPTSARLEYAPMHVRSGCIVSSIVESFPRRSNSPLLQAGPSGSLSHFPSRACLASRHHAKVQRPPRGMSRAHIDPMLPGPCRTPPSRTAALVRIGQAVYDAGRSWNFQSLRRYPRHRDELGRLLP